jgi:HEAT repeat protein
MAWLFYFLSALLLIWALLALAMVAYSSQMQKRRVQRAATRARLQEVFQNMANKAGGSEFINAAEMTEALKLATGNDRECLRDCLVEQARRLQGESLRPFYESYESLRFAADDMRAFQSQKWQEQVDAATRLGHMRCASAIEVLTGALRAGDKDVRLAVICALADIGDPRSVPAIIYSLADADGWQVLQVADKLLHMPVDITRLLLDLLQASSANRDKREASAKMVLELIADFGQRGCERLNARAARSAASQFLSSDSIDMRARAIRAIAAVGIESQDELEQIIGQLAEKDWQIRAVAAKALGQLHQEQAIPGLTQALTDEAWWVRHNAAHALASLGQHGQAALYEQVGNPDRFARDIAKEVIEELQLDAATKA